MEENIPHTITLQDAVCTPGPSWRRSKPLNSSETPIKSNAKKHVKRATVTGDEYQRILQILIRHRILQTPNVKVGTDVSDIYDLDDIVYYNDTSCTFFQIKHSTIPSFTTQHLFKTTFPDNIFVQSPHNKTSPKNSSIEYPGLPNDENKKKFKCELHLALYFTGFVRIKESGRFKESEVEALYFVTNKTLNENLKKYNNYLILEANGIGDDHLLYLEGTTPKKYSLNVKLVKNEFDSFLKKQYNKYMKIQEMTIVQLQRYNDLVHEFLEKIILVVNYPETDKIRQIIMNEIFGDNFIHPDIRQILEHCLIHMEIELLTCPTEHEYLTIKEWNTQIEKVRGLIEKLKMTEIKEYEKKRLTWKVGDLRFVNESMADLFDDLRDFLNKTDCCVFHICNIESVELHMVKVLHYLKYKQPHLLYFYCTLEGLASTNDLLDSFIQGNFELLVIACENENNNDFKEVYNEIEKSFGVSLKRYIFISQNENIFEDNWNITDKPFYFKKQYTSGFKALDESSKQKILEKNVIFQGEHISLGMIFKNNRSIAEEVINESFLWEIVNPTVPCTIFNTEAFSSLGYDKEYYIPRAFTYKNILTNEEKTLYRNEEAMMQQLDFEDIVILVGNSGEGKSTVLTRIANLFKEKHNNMWIIRVNLRTFFAKNENKLKSFGDLTDTLQANKMAYRMAFPNDLNKFEELLFKESLKEGSLKMVFLLDGYNEIGFRTQNKICAFVKTMQSNDSLIQCWITTQIQDKMSLEKKLQVSAYFLEPLSDEDQINLMANYWAVEYSRRSPPEHHHISELKTDASNALQKWKRYISDEKERSFTSVSLNLKMLADILLEKNRKLEKHLNLLDLYNAFVDYKFLCYSRETSGHCSCGAGESLDVIKEQLFANNVRKVLQSVSARTIMHKFSLQGMNKLPGMYELQNFKESVGDENEEYIVSLLKIGLLTHKNGNLELSHESYVQFFFSEYAMIHLFHKPVQNVVMNHVLNKNSLQLCRRFIDLLFLRHIQNKPGMPQRKMTEKNIYRSLNQTILEQKILTIFTKKNQLNVVFEEKLNSISEFILKQLNFSNKIKFVRNAEKHILKSLKQSLTPCLKEREIKKIISEIKGEFDPLFTYENIINGLKKVNFFNEKAKSKVEANKIIIYFRSFVNSIER